MSAQSGRGARTSGSHVDCLLLRSTPCYSTPEKAMVWWTTTRLTHHPPHTPIGPVPSSVRASAQASQPALIGANHLTIGSVHDVTYTVAATHLEDEDLLATLLPYTSNCRAEQHAPSQSTSEALKQLHLV